MIKTEEVHVIVKDTNCWILILRNPFVKLPRASRSICFPRWFLMRTDEDCVAHPPAGHGIYYLRPTVREGIGCCLTKIGIRPPRTFKTSNGQDTCKVVLWTLYLTAPHP